MGIEESAGNEIETDIHDLSRSSHNSTQNLDVNRVELGGEIERRVCIHAVAQNRLRYFEYLWIRTWTICISLYLISYIS